MASVSPWYHSTPIRRTASNFAAAADDDDDDDDDDDGHCECTVGAVKLLGRLLCAIHGCGDGLSSTYSTSYTDSYNEAAGITAPSSSASFKYASNKVEVGELLEATLRDAHSRAVCGLRDAFDGRRNPLGDVSQPRSSDER